MNSDDQATPSNPLAAYEAMYVERPERYRRKVRAWMWLGYAYVVGVIGLLIAFVIGGGNLFVSGTLPIGLAMAHR